MNYRIVRFLDKDIGKLICKALGIFKRCRRAPKKVKRIVFLRFWGIGSTILSTPLVRTIKTLYPDSELMLLTMDKNRGLYEKNQLFDRIMYFDMSSIGKIVTGTPGLLRSLNRYRAEIIIDMEFFSRYSAIVTFFSGSGYSIGFNPEGQGREKLYDSTVPFVEDENRVRSFVRLASPLKVKVSDLKLEPIGFDSQDKEHVDNLIEKEAGNPSKIVLINPNSGDFAEERMWPQDRFSELADRIAKKQGASIIFIGGGSDKDRIRSIQKRMKEKSASFAGKTTLAQTAYLMTLANVFVTNDSGPMHMGFAMQVPTVALFGPESPERYGPLDTKKNRAIYKSISCSPCISLQEQLLPKCKHHQRCMRDITVDEVYAAAEEIIR